MLDQLLNLETSSVTRDLREVKNPGTLPHQVIVLDPHESGLFYTGLCLAQIKEQADLSHQLVFERAVSS